MPWYNCYRRLESFSNWKLLRVGRVSVAIRRFVRTYTRTLVHSYTSAGQEPAGKAHLDRDQVYRTRQVLDRQGFLCVQVSARPQVESGHFGGNNVEQHLLTLILTACRGRSGANRSPFRAARGMPEGSISEDFMTPCLTGWKLSPNSPL